MARYLRLSDRATGPQSNGVRDVTHLIWPESAFPFFLDARAGRAGADRRICCKPDTELITGAVRAARAGRRRARRARLQFDLRDRPRRLDPRHLRQGASGAVRRISAVPAPARTPRPAAAHQGASAASCPATAAARWTCRRAEDAAADLLRGDLSRRRGAARRAAGLAGQCHQRRLVRHQFRALPAFPAGARARHRRRPAAGARRQYRHLRR